MAQNRSFRLALIAIVAFGYIYLLAPLVVIIVSSVGTSPFLRFPPQGFTLDWYHNAITARAYTAAFTTSLSVAVVTAAISSVVGTLAAFAYVRYRFPGRDLILNILMSPLILPTLVLGIAMLLFFSAARIEPSFWRLVAAHLLICIPFVLRAVLPVLQGFDRRLEEAAQNLGATPLMALLLVTLPVIRPGLATGAFFAFITSFDEVVIALFIAPAGQPTLPLQIYAAVQYGLDPTVAAVASLLILVTLVLGVAAQFALGARSLPHAEVRGER